VTTKQKLLLAGGAAVAAFFIVRHFRGRSSGSAFFSELNMVDCNCFSVEFFRDGTTKSTKVPIERCAAEEGLDAIVAACNRTLTVSPSPGS
jgi:hypothetical protein